MRGCLSLFIFMMCFCLEVERIRRAFVSSCFLSLSLRDMKEMDPGAGTLPTISALLQDRHSIFKVVLPGRCSLSKARSSSGPVTSNKRHSRQGMPLSICCHTCLVRSMARISSFFSRPNIHCNHSSIGHERKVDTACSV